MTQTQSQIVGPHLVRYGTPADQKFLLGDFLRTYDTLVINATMAAHTPAALASFIAQRARNKPYFIDPQTHAFQHDVSNLESSSHTREGEIKRSVQRLLGQYGEPVLSIVGQKHEPVLPEDFQEPGRRREFCERIVAFQTDSLRHEAEQSDAAKYYKYLKRKKRIGRTDFGPSLIVAPYFYLTTQTFDDWLETNLCCAEDCREIVGNQPLAVQITISKDVLWSESQRQRLVEAYRRKTKPDLLLLWVDAFSEHEASAGELRALRELILALGKHAPVVNLYGGFFSVMLCQSGLAPNLIGVTHGLEYGEERSVIPVGGGLPIAKFYFPVLHKRLSFRDALRAVSAVGGLKAVANFHSKVCDCNECKKVITTDPMTQFEEYGKSRTVQYIRGGTPVVRDYPLPETKEHCVRHYMWCKARELRDAARNIHSMCQQLRDARKLDRVLGLSGVAHCMAWLDAIKDNVDS